MHGAFREHGKDEKECAENDFLPDKGKGKERITDVRKEKDKRNLAQQCIECALEFHLFSEALVNDANERQKASLNGAAKSSGKIEGGGGRSKVARSANKGIKSANDGGVEEWKRKRFALGKCEIEKRHTGKESQVTQNSFPRNFRALPGK